MAQALPANPSRSCLVLLWLALAGVACVGILGRGYWTPDEPREADIAWRMSWQPAKAVPLLAGEPFCEKPPLAYWAAGSTIALFGTSGWAARLPNLLYALATALAVGLLGRRGGGAVSGIAAAAAIGTFLLSYQVAIWLATDAPLVAAVSVALLGLHGGFYAAGTAERLRGYTVMHAALAVGFLSKSAAAWMVPALTLLALVAWEKRWRELFRWELYLGLTLQAAVIGSWTWAVYSGPNGPAHMKVFFWNNLVGRFARVDAPGELQYAAAHRNSPGKYLIELPIYLWPWTLLVLAAARRAWRCRRAAATDLQPVRFAVAAFVPTLAVLSSAATARNIYLAPALPGVALLLGWWIRELAAAHDRCDANVLRGTALLLQLSAWVLAAALLLIARDAGDGATAGVWLTAGSVLGFVIAGGLSVWAWRCAGRGLMLRGMFAVFLAYSALLMGPAAQVYRYVDAWQNLAQLGREIERDAAGVGLILFVPDETTRAFVDMYTRTSVDFIPAPRTSRSIPDLRNRLGVTPGSLVLAQLPGRSESPTLRALAQRLGWPRPAPRQDTDSAPAWADALRLHMVRRYALPNGRRYALFDSDRAIISQ